MAFVTSDDIRLYLRDDFLNKLIDSDTALLDMAIATAIATAKEYLNNLYDIDEIFNQTGEARNLHLVLQLIYITRYLILQRAPGVGGGKEVPTKAEQDYQDAMAYLRSLAKGEIVSLLPTKPDSSVDGVGEKTNFRWGGTQRGDSILNGGIGRYPTNPDRF
jgi:phage gp36-like protein